MLKHFIAAAFVCVSLTALAAQVKAGYLGIQIKKDDVTGHIVIMAVVGDSPAEKAGLKIDDAIVKLDGADPGALEAFVQAIRDKKPGDKLKLTIKRDDKEQDIEVTLGEMP